MLQYNETGIYVINGIKYMDLAFALKNAGYEAPARVFVRDRKLQNMFLEYNNALALQKGYAGLLVKHLAVPTPSGTKYKNLYLVTEQQLERLTLDLNSKKSIRTLNAKDEANECYCKVNNLPVKFRGKRVIEWI